MEEDDDEADYLEACDIDDFMPPLPESVDLRASAQDLNRAQLDQQGWVTVTYEMRSCARQILDGILCSVNDLPMLKLALYLQHCYAPHDDLQNILLAHCM